MLEVSSRKAQQLLSSVLSVALLSSMHTAEAWSAPAFCKGLDCPKYTVLKTLGDGVELRRYEPGTWASIKASAPDKDTAMRGAFMKLFNYISGSNAAKAKIAMTAPVLTKIEPGQGPTCDSTFTMSFYNPYKLQGAGSAPKPSDANVFISSLPTMEVWVLPYGGYSSTATDREKAAELMKKLEAAKEPFSSSVWYTAGYDSPYTLTNRRNEVWLPRAAAAAASSGTSSAGSAAATMAAEAGKVKDKEGGESIKPPAAAAASGR